MSQRGKRFLRELEHRLPPPALAALRRARALAEQRRAAVYLAGGAVRDLLLGRHQVDVDLVVEGDAPALARELASELDARVVVHERFGTASVRAAGVSLDLATARSERYERPGALPKVEPAGLRDDLARRDFTINAMALRLTGRSAGEIIDPHGGRDDLEGKLVRVLHDESFRDDATRILRAIRYAARFGFDIETETASLLRRDLDYLDTISGARLRHEFERIAVEERAHEMVCLANELGVLRAVHAALAPSARSLRAIQRLPEAPAPHRDALLFCLLLADAPSARADGAAERLSLTGRQRDTVRSCQTLLAGERQLAEPSLRPSEVVRILDTHSPPGIEAFALLAAETASERARRYLSEWRLLKPRLNGHDLELLGARHGPEIGALLAELRRARLDGETEGRDDEVVLARRLIARREPAGVRRG